MKARSALTGSNASQKIIQSQSSKSLEDKSKASPKSPKASDKVEISSEAKSKAEELAKENKLLKAKLEKSKIPNGNEAMKVRSSNEPRLLRKPGIFLIGGLALGGLTGSEGIKEMGEHIPQAEHYGWNQEDTILEQIRRRPPEEAIILVGHGLGGDSAVNIANRLNSLEYGYRKVDLLITMDSTGSNNDIIPQNVKENLNFIDGEGGLFSDGPNIARNEKMTKVSNQLFKSDEGAIDEQSEAQFQIFDKINSAISKAKWEKTEDDFLAKVREAQMTKISSEKLDALVAKDLSHSS